MGKRPTHTSIEFNVTVTYFTCLNYRSSCADKIREYLLGEGAVSQPTHVRTMPLHNSSAHASRITQNSNTITVYQQIDFSLESCFDINMQAQR